MPAPRVLTWLPAEQADAAFSGFQTISLEVRGLEFALMC